MNQSENIQDSILKDINKRANEEERIRNDSALAIPKFLRNLDVKTSPKPLIEMAQLHIDMHRHIDENQFSVIVLGRGFAKTQQISVGRNLAEIGQDPDIRIKLGSESLSVACERLVAVRDHIKYNREYQKIYPNILPSDNNWGSESFTVRRKISTTDPTMSAFGSQTGITGGRPDRLVYDDFCGERVSRERMARETAKKIFWTSLNLLADDGKLIYIGTPFHFDDLTKNLMDGAPQNG